MRREEEKKFNLNLPSTCEMVVTLLNQQKEKERHKLNLLVRLLLKLDFNCHSVNVLFVFVLRVKCNFIFLSDILFNLYF